jgi:ElaB/YqjD/DUF883 family membrane-anchored ribosome-binding protein
MPASNGADVSDAQRLADDAQRRADAARDALPELARRAERAFHDNADRLRTQSREAAAAASEQLDTARMYVIERVQERPFTTTLAALGAGFLIGLLFAGRRR